MFRHYKKYTNIIGRTLSYKEEYNENSQLEYVSSRVEESTKAEILKEEDLFWKKADKTKDVDIWTWGITYGWDLTSVVYGMGYHEYLIPILYYYYENYSIPSAI